MLLSSGFNFVCSVIVGLQVNEVSFHVITHNSEFNFLKFCGILKFVKIREF